MPSIRCNSEHERQSFGQASTRTLRLHTNIATPVQSTANTQQKETLFPHKVENAAWESLGTDIFQLNNNQYLLVVDHYSQFLVIRNITNLTSKTLITQFKSIFTEYRIPKTIISDGGTQYTSQEFQDITRLWQIEHIESSPRNPQSNGLAERFVQPVKDTPLKTAEVGEDLVLALLAYRTTPLSHSLPSLAELLNSRKFKATLPTCFPSLTNLDMAKIHQEMQKSKQTQADYYNQTARDLPSLQTAQTVYVQLSPHKEQMDTSNSHRNHWHLK